MDNQSTQDTALHDGNELLPAASSFNPPTQAYATPYYDSYAFDIDDSLRTLIHVIAARKWLVLGISIIAIFISAYIIEEPEPIYTATSTIQIREYLPPIGGHIQDQMSRVTRQDEYFNTILELVSTRTTAERVLADEATASRVQEYFAELLRDSEQPASSRQSEIQEKVKLWENYSNLVSHSRVEDTNLVQISVTTTDPDLSADLANRHSETFIELSHAERQDSALKVHEFLKNRTKKQAESLKDLEKKVLRYAEKHNLYFNAAAAGSVIRAGTGAIDANDNNYSASRLDDLYQQLSATKVARTRAESQAREWRLSMGQNGRSLLSSDNDTAEVFYRQLIDLEADYETFRRSLRGGNQHPFVKALGFRVGQTKKALKVLERTTLHQLETEAKARKNQQQLIEKEVEKLKQETISVRKRLAEFDQMRSEYASLRQTHQFLTKRLEEAKIALASDTTNVSIIEAAIAPLEADNADQKTYHVLVGCFFGPLLGIAAAFLMHFLDNTIRSTEDIKRTLRLPALGIIPAFSSNIDRHANNAGLIENTSHGESTNGNHSNSGLSFNVNGKHTDHASEDNPGQEKQGEDTRIFDDSDVRNALAEEIIPDSGTGMKETLQAPRENFAPLHTTLMERETAIFDTHALIAAGAPWSIESEAFRNIRTTISYSAADKPPKVMLITSGSKGDGKSTVCANLAVSLAQNSSRVLLIDGDLRRPSMYKMFRVPRTTPGLADYLAGQRDCSEVMLNNFVENLTLITAGTPPPNPTELLGSRRMGELLEMMSTEFDYILIDSPPVIAIADARVLSRLVEGVILVTRSGKTTKPIAQKAANELKQIGAKVLGSVLNGVEISKFSEYDPDAMYYYVEPEV